MGAGLTEHRNNYCLAELAPRYVDMKINLLRSGKPQEYKFIIIKVKEWRQPGSHGWVGAASYKSGGVRHWYVRVGGDWGDAAAITCLWRCALCASILSLSLSLFLSLSFSLSLSLYPYLSLSLSLTAETFRLFQRSRKCSLNSTQW
jgi:hypothetical protein